MSEQSTAVAIVRVLRAWEEWGGDESDDGLDTDPRLDAAMCAVGEALIRAGLVDRHGFDVTDAGRALLAKHPESAAPAEREP